MNERENKTLIFVETKRKADDLTRKMTRVGLEVTLTVFILLAANSLFDIHGDYFWDSVSMNICCWVAVRQSCFGTVLSLVIASLVFVPLWLVYSALPSA